MKTYSYVMKVTPATADPIRYDCGRVTCKSFHEAVKLCNDTDHLNWDDKRAKREIVCINLLEDK